jgi:hypothetical protein
METIRFYLELGVFHVLDLDGYDHVLFMVALALPYAFKSFVRLLLLATAFTVAHTLRLPWPPLTSLRSTQGSSNF